MSHRTHTGTCITLTDKFTIYDLHVNKNYKWIRIDTPKAMNTR